MDLSVSQRILGGFGFGYRKENILYLKISSLKFIEKEIEYQLFEKRKEERKARKICIFGYSKNDIWKNWDCDCFQEKIIGGGL